MKRHALRMAKPLQVYVDDADLERLEAWSKARGWTKSQAVRAALRALTREQASDPLLGASGMIHGLPADLSANVDRALEETFIAKPATRAKRRQAARRVRRH
jgi:hypothetical protein